MRRHGRDLTHIEYMEIKERIKKGAEHMSGHWFEEAYQEAQDLYSYLAERALEYEVENNMLPDFGVKSG